MKAQRTRPCEVCKRPLPMGPKGGGKRRCFECGVRAGLAAAQQMHKRQGPAYDRWRKAMAEVAARLA